MGIFYSQPHMEPAVEPHTEPVSHIDDSTEPVSQPVSHIDDSTEPVSQPVSESAELDESSYAEHVSYAEHAGYNGHDTFSHVAKHQAGVVSNSNHPFSCVAKHPAKHLDDFLDLNSDVLLGPDPMDEYRRYTYPIQEVNQSDTSPKYKKPMHYIRKPNSRAMYSGKTIRFRPSWVGGQDEIIVPEKPVNEFVDTNVYHCYNSEFSDAIDIDNDGRITYKDGTKKNCNADALEILFSTAVKIYPHSNKYYGSNLLYPTFTFEVPVSSESLQIYYTDKSDATAEELYDSVINSYPEKCKKTYRINSRLIKKQNSLDYTYCDKDEFIWHGKMYNKHFIYNMHANGNTPTFDLLGKYTYCDTPVKSCQLDPNMYYDMVLDHGICKIKKTKATNPYDRPRYVDDRDDLSKYNERFEGKLNYIEFDFGQDTTISHIATMGLPYMVNSYSKKKDLANLPDFCYIKYAVEHCNHFTSKFQVSMRKNHGREWINLGIFYGNSDRLNEKLNVFNEVSARYIRVIPLEYQDSPSMSIRFFGPEIILDETKPDKVLKYVIEMPTLANYTTKSFNSRRKDSYHHPKNESNAAKRVKHRSVISKIHKRSTDYLDG